MEKTEIMDILVNIIIVILINIKSLFTRFKVPTWYKEGILYHIFVDRFNNGNRSGKVDNPKKNSFIYGNWEDIPMYIKDSQGDVIRWDFHGGNLRGIINKLGYLKN